MCRADGGEKKLGIWFFRQCAQSLIEYVTLISIVTMALTVLFPFVKRGIQSVVKTGADQVDLLPAEKDTSTGGGGETLTLGQTSSDRSTTQSPGEIHIQAAEKFSSNSWTTSALK
ncbi:MAG: hypothetical protein HQL21_04420 [Candidatus Omnitrophica bacterium]|nr:hypothetical protein [Candidatus Omnitrophota bacterium]